MPLDLYFYGPGYGESTILHWHGDGAEGCAVVDAFLPENPSADGFTLWKLRQLGVRRLDFIAATHPHLDHVRFIHRVVSEFEGEIGSAWWWGGWDRELYGAYFERLAATDARFEQRDRARSVHLFLLECDKRSELKLKAPCNRDGHAHEIARQPLRDGLDIEVFALGPWADVTAPFTKSLADAFQAGRDLGGDLNRTSIGFLVKYGDAQIVLGGDMEQESWGCFADKWSAIGTAWATQNKRLPKVCPHLVKVSHHGSPTGCIERMWGAGGFLTGDGTPPWAVITPWDRAPEGRRLPHDGVVETIRRSGVRVFVTAPKRSSAAARKSAEDFPYLRIRVSANGDREVMERGESVDMAPIPQAVSA